MVNVKGKVTVPRRAGPGRASFAARRSPIYAVRGDFRQYDATSYRAKARIYRQNDGINADKKEATMKIPHYAGIDVHKATIDVVAHREIDQQVYIERRIHNRQGAVRKVFGWFMKEGSVVFDRQGSPSCIRGR